MTRHEYYTAHQMARLLRRLNRLIDEKAPVWQIFAAEMQADRIGEALKAVAERGGD